MKRQGWGLDAMRREISKGRKMEDAPRADMTHDMDTTFRSAMREIPREYSTSHFYVKKNLHHVVFIHADVLPEL